MDSKALYRKYFKRMPDDSIHFLGEKLIIQIPEGFVERGITKIIQTTVLLYLMLQTNFQHL